MAWSRTRLRCVPVRPATLALLASVAACAAPRSPLPSVDTAVQQLQPVFAPDEVVKCIALPLDGQRPCRDTIVQAIMVAIDLRYAEFEIGFFDASRAVGFGSSVAVLGLGTAGALAATGTAQVLSAIAAAVTGTREAFGREVLAEQTAAALLTAMRAGRNATALRIREGLRAEPRQYPLGVALSDIYDYYRAGTLPGALASLTRIAGNEAQLTQDELRRAQPVALTDPARCLLGLLSERVTPLRAARDENRRRMRVAMDALNIPASVRPDQFASDPAPERAAQQRAVATQLGCQ